MEISDAIDILHDLADELNGLIDESCICFEPQEDQIIQPWQFVHGETKATCLWLKGLSKLMPTEIVEAREPRIWKMPPGPDRARMRSKTYPGIARAMAYQWGCGNGEQN